MSINQISVRHHINALLAEGLIFSEEERHGIGRPRLLFSLTEKGLEKFPTSYLKLTNSLLNSLKETLPKQAFEHLFKEMAADITTKYLPQDEGLSIEEKLTLIEDAMSHEGFVIRWEKIEGEYRIFGVSCPYFHVGQSHPEVCTIDKTMISTLLSIPVEKISCILQGDSQCTYVVANESERYKENGNRESKETNNMESRDASPSID